MLLFGLTCGEPQSFRLRNSNKETSKLCPSSLHFFRPSQCPCIYLSPHQSVFPSLCLSIDQSVFPSLFPSTGSSVSVRSTGLRSVSLIFTLSVCLSLCPSDLCFVPSVCHYSIRLPFKKFACLPFLTCPRPSLSVRPSGRHSVSLSVKPACLPSSVLHLQYVCLSVSRPACFRTCQFVCTPVSVASSRAEYRLHAGVRVCVNYTRVQKR